MKSKYGNLTLGIVFLYLITLTTICGASSDESLFTFSKDTCGFYQSFRDYLVNPDTFNVTNNTNDTLRFDSLRIGTNKISAFYASFVLNSVNSEMELSTSLNQRFSGTDSLYHVPPNMTISNIAIPPKERVSLILNKIFIFVDNIIENNPRAELRVRFYKNNFSKEIFFLVNVAQVSDDKVEEKKEINKQLILAVPNPFTPRTSISISGLTPQNNHTLNIYDQSGRLVRLLVNHENSSTVNFTWNGTNEVGSRLPTGVYIASIANGKTILRTKLLLMK